jgi:lipid-binding SYLF domain-containing protein
MTHYVGVAVRLLLVSALTLPSLLASNSAVDRCLRAARVLDSVMGTPEKAIPQDLMSRSHCVAIIPGVKKAGFVLGGHYGKGVLSCRGADGFGWTAPSAVRIEGGSFGLQIGGSSTDLVLLILNKRGAKKLVGSRFTLGADAAVAGGPVGRSAHAQTDAQLQAEILSYSRSKGLFAGISLEGATLRPAHNANEKLYGRQVDPKQVLVAAGPTPPASIQPLFDALNRYSSAKHR